MARAWISAVDLLDGDLPPVCVTSGLPSDTTQPLEVAILSNGVPAPNRILRLNATWAANAVLGGAWLDRADRWTTWTLPHSWESRKQREGRTGLLLLAFMATTAVLFHGMNTESAAIAIAGLVATLTTVALWTLSREHHLRVLAFDGSRYLVAGLHPAFVRAVQRQPTP